MSAISSVVAARGRFDTKVVKGVGCWLWLGSKDHGGYGRFRFNGSMVGAHRFSYQAHVGPIPEGLELDHLCRVPACVNPEHLEPVSTRENQMRGVGFVAVNARKERCANGHEFTPENTYVRPYGVHRRQCRTCNALAVRRYKTRKAAKA